MLKLLKLERSHARLEHKEHIFGRRNIVHTLDSAPNNRVVLNKRDWGEVSDFFRVVQ